MIGISTSLRERTAHLNNDFDLSYSFAKEMRWKVLFGCINNHKYWNSWDLQIVQFGQISQFYAMDPEWNDYVNAKE